MIKLDHESYKLKYEVEFVSLEAARLEEVMASPTTFILPTGEARAAWGRAQLFFDRYSEHGSQERPTDSGVTLASRPGVKERYLFSIEQQPHADGTQFQVRCVPIGDSAAPYLAERNAHNVARFVKDGSIELELLTD